MLHESFRLTSQSSSKITLHLVQWNTHSLNSRIKLNYALHFNADLIYIIETWILNPEIQNILPLNEIMTSFR